MEIINIYSPSEFGLQEFASNLNRIKDINKIDIGKYYYIEIEFYNDRKAMIRYQSVVSRNENYEEWTDEFLRIKEYVKRRYGT